MQLRITAALAALVLALAFLAGCGGDSEDEEPEPPPRPAETVDRLPKLPPDWTAHTNGAGGFAFGVPPGWRAKSAGINSLVRSFDRLVAVSITSNRTNDALELPLDDFATRTVAALPGFEGELDVGSPRPFRHRYRARRVEASGTTLDGVRQRIEVIVLRRDRLATFAAAVAANADPRAKGSERIAERLVETLRGRPVSLTPGR